MQEQHHGFKNKLKMENKTLSPQNLLEKLKNSALLVAEVKKLKDANPQSDFSDIIKEAKKNLEEK